MRGQSQSACEITRAACAAEVNAFLGTATASQFSVAGETVGFAGSEWSYRRMILHYAKLCAAALRS